MDLKKLIVSAPFGNYIGKDWATRTLGTFTVEERPGRLAAVLRTVRYNPFTRTWVNKLGLRNPGMRGMIDTLRHLDGRESVIVSVHGSKHDDWIELVKAASEFVSAIAIELNVSCPNAEAVRDAPSIIKDCVEASSKPIIVKVGPMARGHGLVPSLLTAEGIDVAGWHVANTIPVSRGGLSGAVLRNLNQELVWNFRQDMLYEGPIESDLIIAGGGVTRLEDVVDYFLAGADHVAVGSAMFWPWNWFRFRSIARVIEEIWPVIEDRKGYEQRGSWSL